MMKYNFQIMEFGICKLSVIPLRSNPSDKSEMINQLLFGDLLIVQENLKNWVKVRSVYDNYEGWIDLKQFSSIAENEFKRLNSLRQNTTLEFVHLLVNKKNNSLIPIVFGSSLPGLENEEFALNDEFFAYDGDIFSNNQTITNLQLIESASVLINAPYLWGGRTPFGIDCSGFTQIVFKTCGIKLLRDAAQQATQGELVNFLSEAKAGDLVFFDDDEENIIHVGILFSENKIIHSSGKVRIDNIDHNGIYNTKLEKYTHKLRLIKKII
ncbi:MAG: C40 family peptidase [Bacteroidales bacterium]|nr:C40 family peptidase [Bacteroidales bacterium]